MKRITIRDEFGNADIVGVDMGRLVGQLNFEELNAVTFALNKLAAYEDTEVSLKKLRSRLGKE